MSLTSRTMQFVIIILAPNTHNRIFSLPMVIITDPYVSLRIGMAKKAELHSPTQINTSTKHSALFAIPPPSW